LYLRIIDNFDFSKQWEYAIERCKHLAQQYDQRFLYVKVRRRLRTSGWLALVVR